MLDPKTTEDLGNDVMEIARSVRDGSLSNTVARTLLNAAKLRLDALKMEMEAARLGANFGTVKLAESERNKSHLKRVA